MIAGRKSRSLRYATPEERERDFVMDVLEVSDFRAAPRQRLEGMARARASYAALAADVGLSRVLGRYKMFVMPDDDGMSAHLILDGYWQIWNAIFLARFVRPGWSVLEVGSQLGYFSLLLSELVGPTGRVIGFEPTIRTAGLLQRTIDVNGFSNRFQLEQAAVSGFASTSTAGRGGKFVTRTSYFAPPASKVRTVTLDAYCAEKSIRPDFIKMDISAAKRTAWRGMRGLLSGQQKMALMFEVDTRLREVNWQDCFDEIGRQEFKLFQINGNSALEMVSSDILEGEAILELLALRGYPDEMSLDC